jgi:hypothetical protein
MARKGPSDVVPGHPDFQALSAIGNDIAARIPVGLAEALSELVLEAVEFVLDPVRTGRTKISQLDNVEKTFIGLKVEHFIRDRLDAPKGIRDLILAGHDVDVKNTVGTRWAWMIPPETYRNEEACLLIAANEATREAWMGLMIARPTYLGAPNRDAKRGINTGSYRNILWLVDGVSWPKDRWSDINLARFRELRRIEGGSVRAAMFFSENLRKPIHRSVIETLLFDQLDPMKRLRGNRGAKDYLRPKEIWLLSGAYFNSVLARLGLPLIGNDEFIAVDARSENERAILSSTGEFPRRQPRRKTP